MASNNPPNYYPGGNPDPNQPHGQSQPGGYGQYPPQNAYNPNQAQFQPQPGAVQNSQVPQYSQNYYQQPNQPKPIQQAGPGYQQVQQPGYLPVQQPGYQQVQQPNQPQPIQQAVPGYQQVQQPGYQQVQQQPGYQQGYQQVQQPGYQQVQQQPGYQQVQQPGYQPIQQPAQQFVQQPQDPNQLSNIFKLVNYFIMLLGKFLFKINCVGFEKLSEKCTVKKISLKLFH